ncbi:hypothetical protein ACFPTO_20105 [Paraburkholderia denitrificans]|uniref:Uncharacterized protein n=1 Tax=Paraburkholderia denitrificans TaxID=694025 RepID=A0ABW0JD37_9BURK
MATINAYIPTVTPLLFETEEGRRTAGACLQFGGWNHEDKTLTPIHVEALLAMPHNPALYWVMDSLAAAAEAGRLDADRYVEQLFAGRSDARAFRLVLRDAGADHWLGDRHHNALRKLGCASMDASTYPVLASFFDPEV